MIPLWGLFSRKALPLQALPGGPQGFLILRMYSAIRQRTRVKQQIAVVVPCIFQGLPNLFLPHMFSIPILTVTPGTGHCSANFDGFVVVFNGIVFRGLEIFGAEQ